MSYEIAQQRIKEALEQNLTELDLSCLGLREVPYEIFQLTNLQTLYLFINQLAELPEDFSQLINLQELDLSYNQLTKLPEDFAHLTNLQELDLSSNQLTELPKDFVHLTNLHDIDFSNNQLTELPEDVVQLTNLQKLDLSYNQLTKLPEEFAQLINLHDIDLSNNHLTELPKGFVKLTNLQKLNLGNNQLTKFPADFAQLTNLQTLNLNFSQLAGLPEDYAQLTNLQVLILSNNQLTELPKDFVQLTNLQALNLSNNHLTELPEEFAQRINLQTLDLSNNQLTELPKDLAQLTNLRVLNLSNNHLTELPEDFVQLTNLQTLELNNNHLTELPEEFAQLTNLQVLNLSSNQLAELPKDLAQLTNLRVLNLSNNHLTELPEDFVQLTNLQTLELNNNHLTELPEEFAQLTNLQVLILSNNQLTELPKDLAQLTNLRVLNLSNNHLTELPKDFAQLTNLQTLELNNNHLTELPEEFAQLTNLQTLNLSNNHLTELPEDFAQLTNLQTLNLSNNHLTELPEDFAQLTNLQVLILGHNQLAQLPTDIAKLYQICKLKEKENPSFDCFYFVGENPLRYPPEIIEGGDEVILEYVRSLEGANREWISKMVVVGEGGVGKTSLLRALRGEDFVADEETTHGIEIKKLPLEHPEQDSVTMQLNSWDFGGQEIYHATHQFFLTNRSLYVLAWNARLGYEQGKLNYWLDTIQVRAPQSPVILVATHTDEREANLPLAELQKSYPNIVGSVEISNRNGEKIDELRTLVTDTAAALPLMGEEWPTAWANVRHEVRELATRRNHITPNELTEILDKHEVTNVQARILKKWLHELGEILFFQDEAELNDTVILNSQWVTEAISRVLESDEVIQRVGIFSREHMDKLWSDLPPAMRDHFLRLMEQFDLSYRILEDKDKSLVVERVPYDPPAYEPKWEAQKTCEPCREIKMRFSLDSTMPAGIPTWFIARSHRFTQQTHWRHGALFGDDRKAPNHLALIQAFPYDRYVTLTVRGTAPQNFFALMRDGLEVTFNRFPGLGITRKVPCCGHNGQECSHEFDLKQLEKAISFTTPRTKIECPETFEDVPIAKLLYGFDRDTTEQRLDELLELAQSANSQLGQMRLELDELMEYSQREFTKLFNAEQNKDESRCPYVFVIRDGSRDSDLQGLFGGTGIRGNALSEMHERFWKRKTELQLYCQMPGHWHPCGYERGKDDPATGLYQIELNAELAQAIAQHLPKLVKLLKFARPLVQVGMALHGVPPVVPNPEKLADHIKDDYEKMEKFAKSIEDNPESKMLKGLGDTHNVSEVSGALLRNLRQLLEAKDSNRTWGGLTRYLTKEGHHLWLCVRHLEKYKTNS